MNKQQLANRIWASANKMRSKIDANEYKDYILGFIFYKFLSDTEEKYLIEKMGLEKDDLKELVEDFDNPDMKKLIEECQKSIGYFIEYKNLFNAWLSKDVDFSVAVLTDALTSFDRLMSPNYESVYLGIFKTLREGLSKLGDNPSSQTKALRDLIQLIKDIPTDGRQDYDVLGYVYEYLISNFAASAGKKAGEFYTPHEVAQVMSEIVAEDQKNKDHIGIYDPTSGSGSLLITIGKSVGKHIADQNKVVYYAQELKENTYNLTRMNLVMRGILPQNIHTRCADSLEEDWPVNTEGKDIGEPLAVDAVVSNPPYSQHWDPKDKELDSRFANYGLAPKTKADYAFLLHELHHLKRDGILTIVMPHGVLFRGKAPKRYDAQGVELPLEQQEEGQAEGIIRANLIEKNNIDAIIGLPANIFFGTGIPTLIMVLKKNRTNQGVLIIDASKGFVKDGKQNKLRACDIKKIADTYRDRRSIPGYSREVSREEIRRNEYNLNIPRYVDSSEQPEKYDIYSTMFGGIPNTEIADLQRYWDAFPSLRDALFLAEPYRPYSKLVVGCDDVARAIAENTDVQAFKSSYNQAFSSFRQMLHTRLIDNVDSVKDLEESDAIAADIFRRVQGMTLIDRYAVYQILADHWQDIMGDIEIIQTEGYGAANVVETKYKMVKKDGVDHEVPDGLKGRIIPFELIQHDRFQADLDAITALNDRLSAISSELDAKRDEFDEDEAEQYLDSEKDNAFDKPKIKADAKPKADVEPETKAKLRSIVALWDEETKTRKQVKVALQALEDKTVAAIKALTKKEIDVLLEEKWILPICDAIAAVPTALLQQLTDAIVALDEKYAETYNRVEQELKEAQASLADLTAQLTGDKFMIEGLNDLIKGE
jgi:type I restriction enzyme M protein